MAIVEWPSWPTCRECRSELTNHHGMRLESKEFLCISCMEKYCNRYAAGLTAQKEKRPGYNPPPKEIKLPKVPPPPPPPVNVGKESDTVLKPKE